MWKVVSAMILLAAGCAEQERVCTAILIVPRGQAAFTTTVELPPGARADLCWQGGETPSPVCGHMAVPPDDATTRPIEGGFVGSIRLVSRSTYSRIELTFEPPQDLDYADGDRWTATVRDSAGEVLDEHPMVPAYTRQPHCGDEYVSVDLFE